MESLDGYLHHTNVGNMFSSHIRIRNYLLPIQNEERSSNIQYLPEMRKRSFPINHRASRIDTTNLQLHQSILYQLGGVWDHN